MTRAEFESLLVRIALCVAILALVFKVIDSKSNNTDADAQTTQGAGREIATEATTALEETTENELLYRATEDTDFAEWITEQADTEAQTEAERIEAALPAQEPQFEYDGDAVMIAKTINVEAPHCSTMEQAAVAWTILNRVDDPRFPSTIYEVVTAPYQFAYYPWTALREDLYDLALDVLGRWEREKAGEVDVGRVLPSEYIYYDGDGYHNYFRVYEGIGAAWDWSVTSPYTEG